MRRYLFLITFLAGLSPFTLSAQDYNVLFLGNSYTYSNSLPSILSNLAAADGKSIQSTSNTPGGYTFEGHSTNQTSLNYIQSNDWDFVVLQEQSQRPSFPPSQVAQEVYPYAAILSDSIKSNNECTEIIFFMTWGRKYGDQSNCQFYPPLCTYSGMQGRLRSSYLEMAADNEATCAPVGMAWANSIQADSLFDLYSGDYSHPNYSGSYLAACVFYATIFRESPVGLNYYGSLDSATATYLQNIAAETVLDSLEIWRIGANDLIADFEAQLSGNALQLTSTSQNADSVSWIINPGQVMLEGANANYSLGDTGEYEITLIATSECYGADTTSSTVNYTTVGMGENKELPGVKVYPNPTQDILRVDFEGKQAELELRNVMGELIYAGSIKPNQDINVSTLPKGVYLMDIITQEGSSRQKVVLH